MSATSAQQLRIEGVYVSSDDIDEMRRTLMDVAKVTSRASELSSDTPGYDLCLKISEAVPKAVAGLRVVEPLG